MVLRNALPLMLRDVLPLMLRDILRLRGPMMTCGNRRSESVRKAIVIAVLEGGMSTKEATTRFGGSQRWVQALRLWHAKPGWRALLCPLP